MYLLALLKTDWKHTQTKKKKNKQKRKKGICSSCHLELHAVLEANGDHLVAKLSLQFMGN